MVGEDDAVVGERSSGRSPPRRPPRGPARAGARRSRPRTARRSGRPCGSRRTGRPRRARRRAAGRGGRDRSARRGTRRGTRRGPRPGTVRPGVGLAQVGPSSPTSVVTCGIADGHRLDHRHRQRLGARREHGDVGQVQDGGHVVAHAEDVHPVGVAVSRCTFSRNASRSGPMPTKTARTSPSSSRRRRTASSVQPLALHGVEAGDVHDDLRVLREADVGARQAGRRDLADVVERHAVRDEDELRRRDVLGEQHVRAARSATWTIA